MVYGKRWVHWYDYITLQMVDYQMLKEDSVVLKKEIVGLKT